MTVSCQKCDINKDKLCDNVPVVKPRPAVVMKFAKYFGAKEEQAERQLNTATDRLLGKSVCQYVLRFNVNSEILADRLLKSDEIDGYVKCYKGDVNCLKQKMTVYSMLAGVGGFLSGVVIGSSMHALDTTPLKEMAVWMAGGVAVAETVLAIACRAKIRSRAKILANDIRMFLGNAVERLQTHVPESKGH